LRLLITGATGFIGSQLGFRCLEAGHSVRALGRDRHEHEKGNVEKLRSAGAEVLTSSVTDRDAVFPLLEDIDVVFHLAAAQHEANVPDRHFWDVNVEGTRNLLDAGVAAGIRRFVHGGTIGVYGGVGGQTVRDDSPLEPDNIYGVTKLAGEKVVRSYGDRLDFVIIRIAETYGPGDLRLLKLFRGAKKGSFPIIGRGENLHHLVYIDDLIDGLLLAAEHDRAAGQTFVMAGLDPVSTREMVATVARQLGTSPPRVRVPMGPMLFVATVMQGLLRPLGIQPPLHPRRMNFYRKSFHFSMPEARALGYAPQVDFRTGAERTARWYAENGLL